MTGHSWSARVAPRCRVSAARRTALAEPKLARRWRDEAVVLRRRSASAQAAVLESCAAELETWARERDVEAITLHQAAQDSGFSHSALEKKVRQGAIANVGKKGAPRARYTLGKVLAISNRANVIKRDAFAQELTRIAEWLSRENEKRSPAGTQQGRARV